MKGLLVFAGAMALLCAARAQSGSDTIIRQRAKELSNQNNVRQGVAPPTQPPQGTKPAAPGAQPAPQPTALGRLQIDLGAIQVNTPVTAEQKQRISGDLIASAQGRKPSQAAADKLAESLSAALAEKAVPATDRARLVQDLNALLNGASLPAAQMSAIGDDVQAIFQKNGLPRNKALGVANDVKAIGAEIQKPAAK